MTVYETSPAAGSRGLPARIYGILTSPRATYAEVVAHPAWFGVLVVALAAIAGSTMAFLSTDVGRTALVDQQIRALESWGRTVTDAQYQRLEAVAGYAPYLSAAGQLLVLPLLGLLAACIVYAVLTAVLGGNGSFKQVFAVLAHSSVILALQTLFALPLDYARQSLSSATSLAVFFPMLDESSFLARLLGAIDLFLIWWMLNVAIGLGVLYRRRSAPIGGWLLALYAAIALTFAVIKTVLSGA
jgi:hypothetical protein